MNGAVKSTVEQIDYRPVARPLTFRMIKEDLDALYETDVPGPKKLVMWEHQMDWLVKAERKGAPLEDLRPKDELYATTRRGIFKFCLMPKPAIWGIPVEYHRPLIEREFRDSFGVSLNLTIDDPDFYARLYGGRGA